MGKVHGGIVTGQADGKTYHGHKSRKQAIARVEDIYRLK
jgi:hypothetical protein